MTALISPRSQVPFQRPSCENANLAPSIPKHFTCSCPAVFRFFQCLSPSAVSGCSVSWTSMALGVIFWDFPTQKVTYCVGRFRASRFCILVLAVLEFLSLGVSCLGAFRLNYVAVSCFSVSTVTVLVHLAARVVRRTAKQRSALRQTTVSLLKRRMANFIGSRT